MVTVAGGRRQGAGKGGMDDWEWRTEAREGKRAGPVDDFLEIGSGVAGAPGSGHAVDDGGLMGMVVESIGRGEIVVIKLRGEGKVH